MTMDRVIKFRLRVTGSKVIGYEKWYGGHLVEGDPCSANPCWLYSKDGKGWNPEYIYHRYKDQFTGLLDKNGKEIYEGDIVKMTLRENIGTFNVPDDIIANGGYTGNDDVYEGEVIYVPCCFGLRTAGMEKDNIEIQLISGEDIFLEIIGNIYETPELLK